MTAIAIQNIQQKIEKSDLLSGEELRLLVNLLEEQIEHLKIEQALKESQQDEIDGNYEIYENVDEYFDDFKKRMSKKHNVKIV